MGVLGRNRCSSQTRQIHRHYISHEGNCALATETNRLHVRTNTRWMLLPGEGRLVTANGTGHGCGVTSQNGVHKTNPTRSFCLKAGKGGVKRGNAGKPGNIFVLSPRARYLRPIHPYFSCLLDSLPDAFRRRHVSQQGSWPSYPRGKVHALVIPALSISGVEAAHHFVSRLSILSTILLLFLLWCDTLCLLNRQFSIDNEDGTTFIYIIILYR